MCSHNRTSEIGVRYVAACAVACLVCVLLGYGRSLDAFFVSDDFDIILSVARDGPFGIWAGRGSDFLRPAAALSMYVDHAFWGLDHRGYHAVSLLIHALCSLLVAMIAFLMTSEANTSRRRAETAALAAGLLFAALPTHDEPVIWISGRGDLLAGLFSLTAILSSFSYLRGARTWSLLVALLATTFALLSKEAAASLPIMIIAYAYISGGLMSSRVGMNRRTIVVTCQITLLAVYLLTRRLILGYFVGGYGLSVHGRFDMEVLGKLFAYFPSRILAPALGVVDLQGVAFPLSLVMYAIAIAAAVALLVRCRNRIPVGVVLASFSMTLISIVPVMNLSVVANSSEGSRFLYLPSAMMVLTLVVVAASTLARRTIVILTLTFALPGLMLTHHSSGHWVEAGILARRTVASLGEITELDRIWLLNIPDSLNGAYVFRTGIDSANKLFNGVDAVHRVIPILRHPVTPTGESVMSERLARGRYTLQPSDGAAPAPCYSQINENESLCLRFEDLEHNGLLVSIEGTAADGIASWSSGRLRLLDTWSMERP